MSSRKYRRSFSTAGPEDAPTVGMIFLRQRAPRRAADADKGGAYQEEEGDLVGLSVYLRVWIFRYLDPLDRPVMVSKRAYRTTRTVSPLGEIGGSAPASTSMATIAHAGVRGGNCAHHVCVRGTAVARVLSTVVHESK